MSCTEYSMAGMSQIMIHCVVTGRFLITCTLFLYRRTLCLKPILQIAKNGDSQSIDYKMNILTSLHIVLTF